MHLLPMRTLPMRLSGRERGDDVIHRGDLRHVRARLKTTGGSCAELGGDRLTRCAPRGIPPIHEGHMRVTEPAK